MNDSPQQLHDNDRNSVRFPHIDPIVNLVSTYFRSTERRPHPETVRQILLSFFHREMQNTQIFRSSKFDVSFLWTSLDVIRLAKELCTVPLGDPKPIEHSCNPISKNAGPNWEFVFPSFQMTDHGNQFTFVEEAMHQVMKRLPRALNAVHHGVNLEEFRIFTLGSPTGQFGEMCGAFEQLLKQHGFAPLGNLYAEFVQNRISEMTRPIRHLLFYGISMGANLAVETAATLVRAGDVIQASQKRANAHLPRLDIRLDSAPGLFGRNSFLQRIQITLGFAASTAFALLSDRYTRKVILGNREFLSQVATSLQRKGFHISMDTKQLQLKRRAIHHLIDALRHGSPMPPELYVNQVFGICDPLTFKHHPSQGRFKHRIPQKSSLGRNLVESSQRSRIFAVRMGHPIPFFRQNELRRIGRLAMTVDRIQMKPPSTSPVFEPPPPLLEPPKKTNPRDNHAQRNG